MKIANPIYDIAFKYLLEDEEIARMLISAIVGEEIVSLQVLPQESISENLLMGLQVLRLDFKAEIKLKDGTIKKILIELQKAKRFFDIMRFRRYLGDNYRTADAKAKEEDKEPTLPLPIISVYFLGFELGGIAAPIVHVMRQYVDVSTGEKLTEKSKFIELLTHDSFVIQIPLLRTQTQTALEELLQVFSKDYATKDPKVLDINRESNNPILAKMIKRLSRAITEEDIRRQMDFEDEIERVFQREMEKELAENNKLLDEMRLKAEESDRKAEQERLKAAAYLREIEELKKLLNKKDS